MARLSSASVRKMLTADHRLIQIIDKLDWDLTVIEAHRSIERQKELMKAGKSSIKKAEDGKHTKFPSHAVDIAPMVKGVIYWDNKDLFIKLADDFKKIASELGIKIRWGGDWDRDGDWKDEKFLDMVHFELDEE